MFQVQVAEHVSRDAVDIAKRLADFDSNRNLLSSDRMHSPFYILCEASQKYTKKCGLDMTTDKPLAGGVDETFKNLKKEHNELVLDMLLEFYDSARLVAASGDICGLHSRT